VRIVEYLFEFRVYNIEMKNYITKILLFAVVLGLVFLFIKFLTKDKPVTTNENVVETEIPKEEKFTSELQYKNDVYGFSIFLPETWGGYTIIEDEWEGYGLEQDSTEGQITETGPLISIRHPDWEYKSPRQDIPIMVFTIAQWKKISDEKLSVGAAPIGPGELGRNTKYVFATPARYYFAELTGFEEVIDFMAKKPFKAF
jgi:hypothetical protein